MSEGLDRGRAAQVKTRRLSSPRTDGVSVARMRRPETTLRSAQTWQGKRESTPDEGWRAGARRQRGHGRFRGAARNSLMSASNLRGWGSPRVSRQEWSRGQSEWFCCGAGHRHAIGDMAADVSRLIGEAAQKHLHGAGRRRPEALLVNHRSRRSKPISALKTGTISRCSQIVQDWVSGYNCETTLRYQFNTLKL